MTGELLLLQLQVFSVKNRTAVLMLSACSTHKSKDKGVPVYV